MVSVIHQGDSFRRVLNYNENKVKEGVAVCLEAGYYTKEAANLSFAQKLDRLKKQAALRPNTKVNTVHISLNFDPSEHHSPDKLREIAAAYLDKIGFAEQPYLLYQHHDAGHPHVHILTTNIRPDGGRISLHNLGKNQSEQARREIEIDFSLIKAEDSARRKVYDLKPLSATVEYGKTQTKRAIAGVLDHVLKEYKFSSLSELNAILHQYNISAERGSEDSRVYKNQGLLYRIRTQDGSLKGVPIKASDFFTKPTIKKLETDFFVGKKEKASHSSQLKSAIELVLLKRSINSLEKFKAALQATGIHLATSTNKQGLIYGLTYVDHNTRCVFKGSDLGKPYSAAGILSRWNSQPTEQIPLLQSALQHGQQLPMSAASGGTDLGHPAPTSPNFPSQSNPLSTLVESEIHSSQIPYELSGKRKKKRKKRRSID